jgi:hypothetical protein
VAQRDLEPCDAHLRPLRFPWRMTRVEAAVVGFLRHSYSPLISAATALLFGATAVLLLGFVASDQWNAHVLRERGVVVEGTVVDVPGLVEVTWQGIAPRTQFLDGGPNATEGFRVGSVVNVLSDPQRPGRAHLVGVEPDTREMIGQATLGVAGVFLAAAYAKWARWLAVTRRNAPAPRPGRHQAGGARD